MYSKILILNFPKNLAQKPFVCNLVKRFDLEFNILNATILPRKEGKMVLELFGTNKNFKQGVQYLKENGVRVKNADSDIKRHEEICIHCGACTAVCHTEALSICRPDMEVVFDQNKCSLCELCVRVCPTRAMYIRPTKDSFFGE
ncbi:(Fe-S)-binding protein [Candidatus Magnetomorum sp. HK-1]|nr:(Fe-S)-binding protein [Candidatus Magnetomorum sp. HK-1]